MPIHSVLVDDGEYFDIRPNQHRVSIPEDYQIAGAKGDHKSEVVTFRCPKTIDGHEIADCDMHWINWQIGDNSGKVDVDKTEITTDGDYIYFPWVITESITSITGAVIFSVHFEDLGEDGTVVYRWSTNKNTDLRVVDTQYNPDDEENDVLYVEINQVELLSEVKRKVDGVIDG